MAGKGGRWFVGAIESILSRYLSSGRAKDTPELAPGYARLTGGPPGPFTGVRAYEAPESVGYMAWESKMAIKIIT